MKRIILLSIISGVLFGQQSKPKHYRSAGFLDHKTGMSLVSYARTLKYNNKNWTKFPLRNLAAKYFGKKFAFKNEKIAFSYPIDVFLKSNKSKKFLNYWLECRISKYRCTKIDD